MQKFTPSQVAQMRAMAQQVVASSRTKSISTPQAGSKGKKKSKASNPNQSMVKFKARSQMGNASIIRSVRIGMPDLQAHTVSWVAGFIYVGNGTLGATNGVYFRTNDGTDCLTALVPVMGADSKVGASYVLNVDQLYRRKRYRRITLKVMPLQSSTTNNLTYTIAPVRGPPGQVAEMAAGNGTTAAVPQITVLSMTGNQTRDSFEGLQLDLTPYIAGGSGPKQNEFAVANVTANTTVLSANSDNLSLIPCCFVVGGTSSVSALQATNTHAVIIETVCDYLDFQGANTVVDAVG